MSRVAAAVGLIFMGAPGFSPCIRGGAAAACGPRRHPDGLNAKSAPLHSQRTAYRGCSSRRRGRQPKTDIIRSVPFCLLTFFIVRILLVACERVIPEETRG